jgi:pimeloyl-ACP methyl ester carboxylesterase
MSVERLGGCGRFVDTRGGRMHVADTAQHNMYAGAPLLLLHSTPRSFRQFLPLSGWLPPEIRLIAPDTLGFGNSAPLPANASIENLADCLVDALDALDVDIVDVYGFHTGNKLAAALATRHKERVRHVILAGQTHSLIIEKERRDQAILGIVQKYFAGEKDHAQALQRRWAADFALLAGVWLDPKIMSDDFLPLEKTLAAERYVADFILARHSIVPIYRANFAFDFGAAISAIQAPTLIMEFATAAEAHLGPQAERIAALLRNGAARTFENTGGDVHEVKPKEVARAILAFVRDD